VSTSRGDLLRRHGRNALQFGRFAMVGGTGVVVNLLVLVLVKRLGPNPGAALLGLAPTACHVRWYHL
jgi:putative flippase GtrA